LAGIYIHIPFCRRKCHYCNFFSLASQKYQGSFLLSLKKEIVLTRKYLAGDQINTIYFGGGTPSLYMPLALQEVMEMIASTHDFSPAGTASPSGLSPTRECPTPGPSPNRGGGNTSPPDPSPPGEGRIVIPATLEITLELNPDDVTEEYVAELKQTWFNRFSLGVQSFSDEDLAYLNRSHSAGQSIRAVKLLQDAGFENISIDLIYGIPSSTASQWRRNLETAFSLEIPHISAYALTVEPKTPLAWMIGKQKTVPVSDEFQADQYKILMQATRDHGFLQYEISNFCKPSRQAIHNTNYWNGITYLGLGPSAHSYNGASRRWNVSNLTQYILGIEKSESICEEELLTSMQKYNEYVMTSLRTMWGCGLEKKIYELRITNYESVMKSAVSFVQQGLLTERAGVYFLTDEGKLFADRIASELFVAE